MPSPNYERYSLEELYDALNHINKDAFPENHKALLSEISKRQSDEVGPLEEHSASEQGKHWLASTAISSTPDFGSQPAKDLSPDKMLSFRFVAAILALNGVVILLQVLFVPDFDNRMYVGAVIIDLILALVLFRDPNLIAANIVAIRAALGILVHSYRLIVAGEYVLTLFGIALNASLIILATMELSKKSRTVLVSVAFSVVAIFAAMILENVIAVNNLSYTYSLSGTPVTVLKGKYFDYELTLAKDRWYPRDRSAFHQENPAVDQWLVDSDYDGHIMVIGESITPGFPGGMET